MTLLVGLLVLTSLSAFANPFAEECEKTAIKAALSTEIASAEGEGARLLTELTAFGMDVKQARYKSVHQVNISNGSEYNVTVEKTRESINNGAEKVNSAEFNL